ncbi:MULTISPECIES: hypothetical protein [Sphingobacterium]|nr:MULTISPECIES: hypothetical protein [Sphingobacterium]QIH32272.1 hypothetical protein G6053_04885 [Sphingobacterium sp. DR205]
MEKKLKEINVRELDEKEVVEIEGGTERENSKDVSWFESILNYFKP